MTPEEAAREYASLGENRTNYLDSPKLKSIKDFIEHAFLAGVKWARENPGWISVEKRLPEIAGNYLVYRQYQDGSERKVIESEWCTGQRFYGSNDVVSHWMPLPEPPKEKV